MVGKNNHKMIQEKMSNKIYKYAIRRLSVGVTSVAIAAGLVFSSQVVVAEAAVNEGVNESTTDLVQVADEPKIEDDADSEVTEAQEAEVTDEVGENQPTYEAQEDDSLALAQTAAKEEIAKLTNLSAADKESFKARIDQASAVETISALVLEAQELDASLAEDKNNEKASTNVASSTTVETNETEQKEKKLPTRNGDKLATDKEQPKNNHESQSFSKSSEKASDERLVTGSKSNDDLIVNQTLEIESNHSDNIAQSQNNGEEDTAPVAKAFKHASPANVNMMVTSRSAQENLTRDSTRDVELENHFDVNGVAESNLRYAGLRYEGINSDHSIQLQITKWSSGSAGWGKDPRYPYAGYTILQFSDPDFYKQINGIRSGNHSWIKEDDGALWKLPITASTVSSGSIGAVNNTPVRITLKNNQTLETLGKASTPISFYSAWINGTDARFPNTIAQESISTGYILANDPYRREEHSTGFTAGPMVGKIIPDVENGTLKSVHTFKPNQNFWQTDYSWVLYVKEMVPKELLPYIDINNITLQASDAVGGPSDQTGYSGQPVPLKIDLATGLVDSSKTPGYGLTSDMTTNAPLNDVRFNLDRDVFYGTLGQSRSYTIYYPLRKDVNLGAFAEQVNDIVRKNNNQLYFRSWLESDYLDDAPVFTYGDNGKPTRQLVGSYVTPYLSVNDTDRDGIVDFIEWANDMNTESVDTDGDGVPDNLELYYHQTDPRNASDYLVIGPQTETLEIAADQANSITGVVDLPVYNNPNPDKSDEVLSKTNLSAGNVLVKLQGYANGQATGKVYEVTTIPFDQLNTGEFKFSIPVDSLTPDTELVLVAYSPNGSNPALGQVIRVVDTLAPIVPVADENAPSRPGYARVTFSAGNHGQFADGSMEKIFDVKTTLTWEDFTSSDYFPEIVANDGFVYSQGSFYPSLPNASNRVSSGTYRAVYAAVDGITDISQNPDHSVLPGTHRVSFRAGEGIAQLDEDKVYMVKDGLELPMSYFPSYTREPGYDKGDWNVETPVITTDTIFTISANPLPNVISQPNDEQKTTLVNEGYEILSLNTDENGFLLINGNYEQSQEYLIKEGTSFGEFKEAIGGIPSVDAKRGYIFEKWVNIANPSESFPSDDALAQMDKSYSYQAQFKRLNKVIKVTDLSQQPLPGYGRIVFEAGKQGEFAEDGSQQIVIDFRYDDSEDDNASWDDINIPVPRVIGNYRFIGYTPEIDTNSLPQSATYIGQYEPLEHIVTSDPSSDPQSQGKYVKLTFDLGEGHFDPEALINGEVQPTYWVLRGISITADQLAQVETHIVSPDEEHYDFTGWQDDLVTPIPTDPSVNSIELKAQYSQRVDQPTINPIKAHQHQVTGQALPGASVEIMRYNDQGQAMGRMVITADNQGNFTLATPQLTEGESFVAKQSVPNMAESLWSDPVIVQAAERSQAPTQLSQLGGIISGQSPSNAIITLVDASGQAITDANGQPLTTQADADGNFTFTLPSDSQDGRQIAAVAQDGDRLVSEPSLPLVIDLLAPSISSIDNQTVVSGNPIDPFVVQTDDSEATISVNGLPKGVTFDPGTGLVKGTPTVEFTDGQEEIAFTVTVTAMDPAGNESKEKFIMTIQRDTDGDGKPDVTDADDDGDGFTDEEEIAAGTDPKDENSMPDTQAPTITAIDNQTVVAGQSIDPFVVQTDDSEAIVSVDGLPEGVTYDPATGLVSGSPSHNFTDEEEVASYDVTVTATDAAGNESSETISITVQRDTDGDGVPDITDTDDDGDGIPDEEEISKGSDPKDADSIPATVITPVTGGEVSNDNQSVVEGQPIDEVTITPENEAAEVSVDEASLPNGLTFNPETKTITGTPAITDWADDEESRELTTEVTITNPDGSSAKETVNITVQRDTDGDGKPDVTDTDDDGDGFTDEEEIAAGTDPKDENSMPDTQAPTITAIDNQTVLAGQSIDPFVVQTDDSEATVSVDGLPEGVTYDPATGLVSGSPSHNFTDEEEVASYDVTVTATDAAGNESSETFSITVQRDTDGDGVPDITDTDDDGDGIPDEEEISKGSDPKDADSIPATVVSPVTGGEVTNDNQSVVEGQPIDEVTITPENEAAEVSVDEASLPNGLTFNPETKTITGTPAITDWADDEESRELTTEVTITNPDGSSAKETVNITVQRDTDGDGKPDVTDTDDDGDGFTDEEEIAAGTDPKDENSMPDTQAPTITAIENQIVVAGDSINPFVVQTDDPEATISVDGLPEGVTYDPATGLVSGKPSHNFTGEEEAASYDVTVTATDAAGNESSETFSITVQRDTDGDGVPDITDTDDDGDGIPDEEEISKGSDPKDADSIPAIVITPVTGGEVSNDNQSVVEGQAIADVTITPENEAAEVLVDEASLPNGLAFNPETKAITGTPAITDWVDDEESRELTTEVTITNPDGSSAKETVNITVQRDTDGDGKPDVTDADDDGDGFTDEEEIAAGTDPKDENSMPDTQAPTITAIDNQTVVAGQSIDPFVVQTDDSEATVSVDGLPEGVTYDPATGLVSGNPSHNFTDEEEVASYDVTVTATDAAGNESSETFSITVQRDTDGDGVPDITDTDDDGDGIPDEEEISKGSDPKDVGSIPMTPLEPGQENNQVPVVSGDVNEVQPDENPQDTGINVDYADEDTTISAKDEDGKFVPVTIDEEGNVIITPGVDVDGPITVIVDDPELDQAITVIVPVEGHKPDHDDNNSDFVDENGDSTVQPSVELVWEDEIIPFETIERENPNLPQGQRRIVQVGQDGLKRTFYEVTTGVDGEVISRVALDYTGDNVAPVAQIIEIGTGTSENGDSTVQPSVELVWEDEIIPFETIERENPNLPQGQRRIVQVGQDGLKRTFYEVTTGVDGEVISRVALDYTGDNVEAIAQIVEVGTKVETPNLDQPIRVEGQVQAVQPNANSQDTGINVINIDEKTKISAHDEDGKALPVMINENGDIFISPGTDVDGPITVIIAHPDLLDGFVAIEMPVNGDESGRDDNTIDEGDDNDSEQISDKQEPQTEPTVEQENVIISETTKQETSNKEEDYVETEEESEKLVKASTLPSTGADSVGLLAGLTALLLGSGFLFAKRREEN
ncbi:putative Ig domain-containing protein [Aerococcus kribbianus]|uniref:Ig domain-containing protein n=1 Tax=Aerococcus kribbianus TaxID=2999064 RepID=A0A9X3FPV0_9LACT|nr:putative Ig domain-containing protein [Aerococcus sp. YH-aer222]MCZ0726061.1 putative Ig domain-containing protein [Aerococcus sp. YH-aer222]